MKKWFVYILECKNGSLYTGITNDLKKRFKMHCEGKAAKYTRAFGVKRMVYKKKCLSKSSALKKEAAIKNLPRQSKLDLIHATEFPRLLPEGLH